MVRTITKCHVHQIIKKDTREVVDEIELPKNTYSPKAARKVLEERGLNADNYTLIYGHAVQEKRELSDEDFIKYSKVVE